MAELIYEQIKNDLLKQIHTAQLRPGKRLPSERKLIRKYNVSITSVRRALDILKENGYIEKRHGSGNYVREKVQSTGECLNPEVLVIGREIFGRDLVMGSLLTTLSEMIPGVKTLAIDCEYISLEQVRQLLKDYQCPIIMLNCRNQTAEMAEAGLLVNLEKIPQMMKYINSVPQNIKWRFKGRDEVKRFYACPYIYAPTTFAINLDLAKAAGLDSEVPPRTWEEAIKWSQNFMDWKKLNKRHDLFSSYMNYSDIEGGLRSFFFMAADGIPYNMDASQVKHAMNEYFTFFERLIQQDALDICGLQSPDPFVSGKYLFSLQAGPWMPKDIKDYRPNLNVKYIQPPVPELYRPCFNSIGTSLISIAVDPDKDYSQGTALEALSAMFEPNWHIRLAECIGEAPAPLSSFRQFVKKKPEMQPFYDAMIHSLEPHCPSDRKIEDKINALIKLRLADRSSCLTSMTDNFCQYYLREISKVNL